MLRTLTRLFRPRRDVSQLELGFHGRTPHNADELLARLTELGLRRIARCRLTRNRNVMVSFGGGALRVHEGYLGAPEPVLRAIVAFVEGRTRAERRDAQRTIVSFPIRLPRPPARRERTHPDDLEIAEQLNAWHERYNRRHFHAALRPIEIRVSRRMKTRLGHYTACTPGGEPAEIAISRAHLRKHGWQETLHTLVHEMVHQWQDEMGHTIDHGSTFRAKAREVGVAPYARRVLATRPGRGEGSQTLGRRAARKG
ncbi:MAG: SprT-like domain-containing protein [Gemmatimonadota bacterium]|nr:SprT-like domain-containing protein [Gemmatimonadota bacterium]